MKKRDILLKILLYALYLLLFYLLQAAVFPRLPVVGIRPLILPVAVVGIGLYEGDIAGALAGLVAGLLCDISLADSISIFLPILTAAGALVGLLARRFLRRSLSALSLCALLVSLLCAFLQAFGFVVFQNAPLAPVALRALGQTLYSVLFVLPVWALLRAIAGRFRKA